VSSAFAGYAETAYNGQGIVDPIGGKNYWYNPNITKYSLDQNKSLALLSSIGINKGSDGLLHYPNGTAVSLTLWADTDQTEDTVAAAIVQNNLQTIGFTIPLQITSLNSIIGDLSNNGLGIQSAMILKTFFGNDNSFNFYFDSLPGWDTYWVSTTPSHHWLWPPSVDAQYQSNNSAMYQTGNTSVDQKYLFNMELLDSQNLPTIVLAYPSLVYAYSTSHWTNWPNDGSYFWSGGTFNATSFTALQPAGFTTSTTVSTSSSSASQSTSQQRSSSSLTNSSSQSQQRGSSSTVLTSSGSSPQTTVTTSSLSSSSTTASSSSYLVIGAVAVVVIIIIAGAALYMTRRGKKS
jgi:hypothetical protein